MTSNPDFDSAPPKREVTFSISIPSTEGIPIPIAVLFSRCLAEAQLLEQALKTAIANDVVAFAPSADQISYLEFLQKRVTLGSAKHISTGTASDKTHKEIAAHVDYFVLVKMQWAANGRSEPELEALLKEAVSERNRIAHSFLAEIISEKCNSADAIAFLGVAESHFRELRILISGADFLSGKMGSVAPDGSSLPRVKITK
jgi:hypothetical protein